MSRIIIEREGNAAASNKETFLILGGVALVALGAGLILRSPTAKRYLRELRLDDLVTGIVPDIQRYFKLRSM